MKVPQWVSLILLRVSNPQKTSIWSVWQFGTRLSSGHAIGASLQKIRKSHSIPISTMIRLIKALAWPVAMYGCESGTLRKNEETHHDIFEMKGLRKILRVSWNSKETHEWVLNKAGVKRELFDTLNARKLVYSGHTMRKQGSCVDNEIMQGTMPGARRRGRPCTAWMDNINTWTGLPVEESVRMTEINGESTSMVWPTLESITAEEQNRPKFKYNMPCNAKHPC